MKYEGKEVFFDRDELIVSKTDLKGKLTYANKKFLDIAGYEEEDVLGQQHNIIRNTNMPRVIFKYLWDTLSNGNEIFAYVVNSTKSGDHYWVIAHVTPSKINDKIIGYHSTRRVPNPATIKNIIEPLYDNLKSIEDSNPSKKTGLAEAEQALLSFLKEKGQTYDEFISQLTKDD